jgi:hypothetical protein
MGGAWREPRWLVGGGVVLLAAGYAVLSGDPGTLRAFVPAARLAFYGGLALLVAGVAIWLRRPPRPDPAETDEDEGLVEGDG